MNNKDFYQRTFSQVHSSSEIRWEDYSMKNTKNRHCVSLRLAAILIAATLLTLLCGTALAVNFKGLRDLLLSPPQDEPGEYFQPLSLFSGYMDSPESQALAEWLVFLNNYDPDNKILHSMSGSKDESLNQYYCYSVYTQEMAQELERIADKYSLRLHTDKYDPFSSPELVEPLGDFMGNANGTPSYMYEDGSFHVDGDIELEGFGSLEFQFGRSVRGTLHDSLYYDDISTFREWNYVTAEGLTVRLALGQGTRAMILAELEDCFVSVLVLAGENDGLTQADLEKLADNFRFTQLTPVVTPKAPENNGPLNPPAGETTDARKTYAAVLRDLLYNGVLPDYYNTLIGPDIACQFAIGDVNGDDEEELILLCNAPDPAESTGLVVGFSSSYTGNGIPIYLGLQDYPDFTFYEGGYIVSKHPEDQGLAGNVLCPYTLYSLGRGGHFYSTLANVDAWDKASFPTDKNGSPFPDELDKDGDGAIYYVSVHGLEIWDRAEYEAWLQTVPLDKVIELTYLPLNEENISAIEFK